jgi:hypothetical protein
MNALRNHYPEYLMEAAGLGLFMIAASAATVLLEHPLSPIRPEIPDPLLLGCTSRPLFLGCCWLPKFMCAGKVNKLSVVPSCTIKMINAASSAVVIKRRVQSMGNGY